MTGISHHHNSNTESQNRASTIIRRIHGGIPAIVTMLMLAFTSVSAEATFARKQTLYERLGGKEAIVAVVDDFIGNVAADKRINRFFANTDIPRLKRRLVEQICAGTGGPCKYRGRSMKAAHKGLRIEDRHFNALVQDLGKSLKKFKVPAREQKELVAILAPLRKDIVGR